MCIFKKRYSIASFARPVQEEIVRSISELSRIGRLEDYLAERPGGAFDQNCRHIRTREIGKRLEEIGGVELMQLVFDQVERNLGRKQAHLLEHLGYCWNQLGGWKF